MSESTALTTLAEKNLPAAFVNDVGSNALAAQARAMVEARYVMALKSPRNWARVRQDLLDECRRPSFAHNKSALYSKPVGGGKVEGLGIRFAEVALRCMNNVLSESFLVFEDERMEVHRVVVTDLENNNTQYQDVVVSKTVERSKPLDDGTYLSVRKNSQGKFTYTVPAREDELLDKRAARISKALRTVALRIIPGYLQDEAEAAIREVRLDKAARDPDAERNAIVDAFNRIGLGVEQVEEYLGHSIATTTPAELVDLRGLYGSLRDGETNWGAISAAIAERKAAASEKEKEKPAGKSASERAVAEKAKQEPAAQPQQDAPQPEDGPKPPTMVEILGVIKAGRVDDAEAMIHDGLSAPEKTAIQASIAAKRKG